MRPHALLCHHLKLPSVVIVLFSLIASSIAAPAYPLKQSANGRYLVDQLNVPFLLTGDSPQSLIVNLSTNDAAIYFADRAGYGFNTVWVNLLCDDYTYGRLDGSTYDGILPFTNTIRFTSSYDLTTPNEDYFARVDSMIQLAAQYGLLVVLDPIETGGWLIEHGIMGDNGTNRCFAYGQFLGNRYKDFPNIVWMSGNDYQTWSSAPSDALVMAVARGIQDSDSNHIHSIELNYPVSSSLDDAAWAPVIKLNAAYTYTPTYAQLLLDYGRTNFLPNILVEANYEFEDNFGNLGTLTPQVLRRQEYWTMLSGACGQLYGNLYTVRFISGWQTNLDTPGVLQLQYMVSFFESRAWYDLIPDTNHSLLTAGYGTYATNGSVNSSDFATAASTADGTLAAVYLPSRRTLTLNLSKLSGVATARWFDPASGTYTNVSGSPFSNSGLLVCSPPGNNSDGQGDWVLVMEMLAPSLSIGLDASTNKACIVSFTTISGQLYDLQASTNFATGPWTLVSSNILGTGQEVQVIDTIEPDSQKRFYRAEALGTAPGPVLNVAPASRPQSGVVISFHSLAGRLYDLQSKTNWIDGPWLPVATNILGTGGILKITDTHVGAVSTQFYRARLRN